MRRSWRRAAAALAALICISLTSCDFITINNDKWNAGGDESADAPVTNASVTGRETVGEPTDYTPPPVYEYGGRRLAEEYLSQIDFDMNGATVIICSADEKTAARLSPESDDSYSSAVRERNSMIESALGCSLYFDSAPPEQIIESIRTSIESDTYFADMIAVPEELLPRLAADGLIVNFDSLPFFSAEEEWFFPCSDELSAAYRTYGAYGCADVDPDSILCVFASGDAGSLDRYESAARAGEWTWDFMLGAANGKIAICDIYADDAADPDGGDGGENGGKEFDAAAELLRIVGDIPSFSSGLRFVDNEKGREPTVVIPDGITEAADAARRLLSSASLGTSADLCGGAQFYIGTLGMMNELAGADSEWTVLPLPKLTGKQTSYSSFCVSQTILTAPANTTDPDGTSALINAFAASSAEFLCDAYVEYAMYNTVRRESTLPMISLVYGSAGIEMSRIFDNDDGDVAFAAYELFYELINDAGADLEKLFDKRRGRADKFLSGIFPA